MQIVVVIFFWALEFAILGFLIWVCIYLASLTFLAIKNAPYVPTMGSLEDLFKQIPLKKGQTFLDLGSGDGKIVNFASRKYQLKATGFEINPVLVFISRLYAKLTRSKGTFKTLDFMKNEAELASTLARTNIIYTFLLPRYMEPLAKQIRKHAKPGTLIIAHGFQIPLLSSKLIKTLDGKRFQTFYYKL